MNGTWHHHTMANGARMAGAVITCKTPWSMTYSEYVDAIIERLKERVGHTHPLFAQDIFVAAVSNDPEAALLEIDSEGGTKYAVLYYHGNPGRSGESLTAPAPELVFLQDADDVQRMIDEHHRDWVKKYAEE